MAVTLSAAKLKDLAAVRAKRFAETAFEWDVAKVTKWRDSVTVAELNTLLREAVMAGKDAILLGHIPLNNVSLEREYEQAVAEEAAVFRHLTGILGEGIAATLELSADVRRPAFVIKLSW
jgi:hypothetical protein